MNKLNLIFQSESSKLIYLISSTKDILSNIFKNLKKEYIMQTNIEQIDFYDPLHIKDTFNIYIGHEAELEIYTNEISTSDIVDIKTKILLFYQNLCSEILSRINISDKRLNLLKYLDPAFIKSTEDINYFEIVSVFSDVIAEPDDFVK